MSEIELYDQKDQEFFSLFGLLAFVENDLGHKKF